MKELNDQFKELKKSVEEKPEQGIKVSINDSTRLKICLESIRAINKIMDSVKEDFINVTMTGLTIKIIRLVWEDYSSKRKIVL